MRPWVPRPKFSTSNPPPPPSCLFLHSASLRHISSPTLPLPRLSQFSNPVYQKWNPLATATAGHPPPTVFSASSPSHHPPPRQTHPPWLEETSSTKPSSSGPPISPNPATPMTTATTIGGWIYSRQRLPVSSPHFPMQMATGRFCTKNLRYRSRHRRRKRSRCSRGRRRGSARSPYSAGTSRRR